MALSKPRQTKQQLNGQFVTLVGAKMKGTNTRIYDGSMVDVNASGYALPAATSTTQRIAGVYQPGQSQGIPGPYLENTGSDGDVSITLTLGTFLFANDPDDAVTQADINLGCYVKDDQTVSRTSGGSTRHLAGTVVGLNAATDQGGGGVWVNIGAVPTGAVGSAGPTGPGGGTGPTGPTGPEA